MTKNFTLSMIFIICYTVTLRAQTNKSALSKQHAASTLLKTFKDKNGEIIGSLYVDYIKKNIFKHLYIVKEQAGKVTDTLYQVKNNVLFRKETVDVQVSGEDFYGYKMVQIKPYYFEIVMIDKHGTGISDYLTINWNVKKKRFELVKTP
ncbi:hypothetical protein IDJ77_26950 [Mucilaginibacter sp. ZT4R22]|uniref:DUF4783 domain-containing protein n=1 Tax=Mucilaginibacter pankratovii TaxID=2772110 RepID=A0ABR7WYW4_9SPHI|nr:hypothetical protein [Mucilaginibacter pankratovii]MBD1367478.1 hypothetical protein [Mucilaginibacter pankratovii]